MGTGGGAAKHHSQVSRGRCKITCYFGESKRGVDEVNFLFEIQRDFLAAPFIICMFVKTVIVSACARDLITFSTPQKKRARQLA